MTHETPNNLLAQELTSRVNRGVAYLQSITQNGLISEFEHEARGGSDGWITVCVGSALSEFDAIPSEMVPSVINLRDNRGGWGWNNSVVPTDADSTLRAMQFLRKAGVNNPRLFKEAEAFVLSHQQPDGGIATFLPEDLQALGKEPVGGWIESHPCVSALALKQITNPEAKQRIKSYLENHIKQYGYRTYWWDTPQYVAHELGAGGDLPVDTSDALDVSLDLLRKAKHGIRDDDGIQTLLRLQRPNGQFLSTTKFLMPGSEQSVSDIVSGKVPPRRYSRDEKGALTTPAAIVALHRQKQLLLT
jgi:hypothetical protein